MDIISIKELKIPTIIGTYNWERQIQQTLILDIDINCNVQAAANSNQLELTCDYAKLVERIKEFTSINSFNLLETLAERMANLLLDEFALQWIKLRIAKPGAIANAKEVAICIERTR